MLHINCFIILATIAATFIKEREGSNYQLRDTRHKHVIIAEPPKVKKMH
jgi:hypothetical protein